MKYLQPCTKRFQIHQNDCIYKCFVDSSYPTSNKLLLFFCDPEQTDNPNEGVPMLQIALQKSLKGENSRGAMS